jgi:site-specific DNA recombinase
MRGRKSAQVTEKIAALYARVSSVEQAESGHSLRAQTSRLKAYALGTERVISEEYVDDGYSAGNIRRPALQRLLDDVKQGRISAIFVTKLDRLSRSLSDLLELVRLFEKHNVALVSASESVDTSNAAGRMMLQLLGSFAEFEHQRGGERTREVLADRRLRGKVYSRVAPFGYARLNDELREDVREQQALATMRLMRSDGASYRQIASWLTENGYQAKGAAWYGSSVRAILTSAMNATI